MNSFYTLVSTINTELIRYPQYNNRLILFDMDELSKIYPALRIKDGYIIFPGTDILINIKNYNYLLKRQSYNGGLTIFQNNIYTTSRKFRYCYYRQIDNNQIYEHYIYPFMIKTLTEPNNTGYGSTIIIKQRIESKNRKIEEELLKYSNSSLSPRFKKTSKGLIF